MWKIFGLVAFLLLNGVSCDSSSRDTTVAEIKQAIQNLDIEDFPEGEVHNMVVFPRGEYIVVYMSRGDTTIAPYFSGYRLGHPSELVMREEDEENISRHFSAAEIEAFKERSYRLISLLVENNLRAIDGTHSGFVEFYFSSSEVASFVYNQENFLSDPKIIQTKDVTQLDDNWYFYRSTMPSVVG